MLADRIPPDYAFHYVMECPRPIDPRIRTVFVPYSEEQRWTHDILLGGVRRPLIFLTHEHSRDAANRRYWKDVTRLFESEWRRTDTGGWAHEPQRKPVPIDRPDVRCMKQEPVQVDESSASMIEELLSLGVRKLAQALATGAYDGKLRELLQAEQEGRNVSGRKRSGACAAILTRMGVASS